MELAARMEGISQAVFCEMDALSAKLRLRGAKVINLGIGSPDGEPAPHVKAAFIDALDKPDVWGYATTQGSKAFREAVSAYYRRRFGIEACPDTQVHSLMGSQDGLAHIALAFMNPGDVALIPDPGYPIYSTGVVLAGGTVYSLPLTPGNAYLPDFEAVPPRVARSAKLMILNYPNNPLSVVADITFLEKAVAFARENGIVLCYDNAYSELAFDGFTPPSVLQVPGAWDCCVEFNSLSKAFNMAGMRVAYAVGNADIINAIGCIKSHADYGVFLATQAAAIAALDGPALASQANMRRYQARRDLFISALAAAGWDVPKPMATMFVWAKVPLAGMDSRQFARGLLEEEGVAVIPGEAFGRMGKGYVRMAMVHPDDVLTEAAAAIGRYLRRHA